MSAVDITDVAVSLDPRKSITREDLFFRRKWWQEELLIQRKPRKPKLQAPLQVIQGSLTQSVLDSPYAGTQCTSICLQCICYWQHSKYKILEPIDLDHIVLAGNSLHENFREQLSVSSDGDLRVSLEEVPNSFRLYNSTLYKQYDVQYLSIISSHDQNGLRSLRDYLEGFMTSPFGVVVTVEDYSMALMYLPNRNWAVFDSHGNLHFEDHDAQYVSCWIFRNLDAVTVFLRRLRCNRGYCSVLKPFIVGGEAPVHDVTPPVELGDISDDDEEDPYISLMGGFGGY